MYLISNYRARATTVGGALVLGATAFSLARTLSPMPEVPTGARSVPTVLKAPNDNALSLADGALTIDIEARLRGEIRNNNFDFDSGKRATTDGDWLLARERIGALWKACPEFRMYVQFQDSREFGSNRTKVPGKGGAEGNDPFDLRQAWMEFGNAANFPLTLKVGRQTLTYGDERLVGASEWNNLGRVFDAAKIRWEEKTWSVDLFSGSVVDMNNVKFDQSDFLNGREKRRNQVLSGLYASTSAFGPQTTDLYLLQLHEEVKGATGGGRTNFFTYGVRVKSKPGAFAGVGADGKLKPVGFDYYGEFAYQRGKLYQKPNGETGALTWLTAGQRDLSAYAFSGGFGYTVDALSKPRVGVAYSYATGDKDSTDSKVQTFQNLFPTNHKFYGAMDVFSWQNMHDLELNFKCTPVKNVTVKSELHGFWLANKNDAWYRANGASAVRTSTTGASSFAGTEADLITTWSVSKPLQVEAGYSHFFAGSYLKDAGSKAHADADFGYLQMKITF